MPPCKTVVYFIYRAAKKTAKGEKNVGIGTNYGALFKENPEWAGITPVSGEMKRGDCGFHNGLTAHGPE